MIVGFIAVVGGIGCCIAMIVMVATGKVKARFDPPAPGGSVYLEMLPVFAAAFLGVKIGLSSIISVMYGTASTPDWMILASLGLQWMLVAIIAWPRLRGVPWSRARMDLGWHSGRGVLREMAAGLFGYFAALPLLFLAMAVTVVYMLIRNAMRASRGEPPAQPDNAILEIITKAGTAELVLVFLLATVWAPLVEETIFRGGVYRHLRSRVPMLVAAVISAIAFGVMHGYEFLMLLPVMTLGFSFALIREWRGSLVGSMFVHGLHNATVMCFLLAAMSILRD
jgi:membrane protease YdiL (CAAX protease family)